MFQSTDLSGNLFSYDGLNIFVNCQMNNDHVGMVRALDPSYVPRTKYSLNRTVTHNSSNTVVQMDINMNVCEIVLPTNQDSFKTNMFRKMVNLMIESLKLFLKPSAVNDIGFKIFVYAPTGSPASHHQWWVDSGITSFSWGSNPTATHSTTVLETPLTTPHSRFVLWICLDDNYNLIKEPSCDKCHAINATQNGAWAIPTTPVRTGGFVFPVNQTVPQGNQPVPQSNQGGPNPWGFTTAQPVQAPTTQHSFQAPLAQSYFSGPTFNQPQINQQQSVTSPTVPVFGSPPVNNPTVTFGTTPVPNFTHSNQSTTPTQSIPNQSIPNHQNQPTTNQYSFGTSGGFGTGGFGTSGGFGTTTPNWGTTWGK